MTNRPLFLASAATLVLAACSKSPEEPPAAVEQDAPAAAAETPQVLETVEIAPGLTANITQRGYGRAAQPGDLAEVHYTGWLFDASAVTNRGAKFDSSVDRGESFSFPLGAGRVIKGWDQGVDGMLIGEKRELVIAPEMGYGDRGAGNAIPPGATLLFEVELLGLMGPEESQ